ncbi:hypothetical protein TIFTF001_009871 [Ficus carica]|uniref:Uncharacterized protein n=1 Tax=Ficus carica TaxID=3494 RepID=A0AA88DHK5_FICCA|nr:hypothetical protein TIFTF001_009871 [Ficus carica]
MSLVVVSPSLWVASVRSVSLFLPPFHLQPYTEIERVPEKLSDRLIREMGDKTTLSWSFKGLGLGFLLLWWFGLVFSSASIHEYGRESFIPQSDAFFFHGGSEGLYASKLRHDSSSSADQSSSSSDKPLKGKSFIRFDL